MTKLIKQETYQVTIATSTRRQGSAEIVESEFWKVNGRLHREGGPAYLERQVPEQIVLKEVWCRAGRRHRDNGPAVIYRNPQTGEVTRTEWFVNGVRQSPPRRRRELEEHTKVDHQAPSLY